MFKLLFTKKKKGSTSKRDSSFYENKHSVKCHCRSCKGTKKADYTYKQSEGHWGTCQGFESRLNSFFGSRG